jgi:(E)-4-hydroxy-3-methyl-but-2-enyl pyrophosphate reductase
MSRQIIIAENAGFCFGVKRAVEMTVDITEDRNSRVYTLGPLIHNKAVVESLKDQRIFPIDKGYFESLSAGDTVVIRSHGVSSEIIEEIKKTGASIVDATCPYVTSIQRKAKKYYDEGYQIIIVGDPEHPEVIGINGWCDNKAIITRDGEELKNLPDKVCVLSQTTEKQANYEKTLEVVSKLSQDVLTFNTICSATRERQESAHNVSKKADLMVVIGGRNSSNTKKLYEICSENCRNTILVENGDEIPVNIAADSTLRIIGVTAGASTPEWIISEVIDKLKETSFP